MPFENIWANMVFIAAVSPTAFILFAWVFNLMWEGTLSGSLLKHLLCGVGGSSVLLLLVGYFGIVLTTPPSPVNGSGWGIATIGAIVFAILLCFGGDLVLEDGVGFGKVALSLVPAAVAVWGLLGSLEDNATPKTAHVHIVATQRRGGGIRCLSSDRAGTDFLFAKKAYFLPAKELLEPLAVTATVASADRTNTATAVLGFSVKVEGPQASRLFALAEEYASGKTKILPGWLTAERVEVRAMLCQTLVEMGPVFAQEMACGADVLAQDPVFCKEKRRVALLAGARVFLGRLQARCRQLGFLMTPDALTFRFPE